MVNSRVTDDESNTGNASNAANDRSNSGDENNDANDESNRGHESNDANDESNRGDQGKATSDENSRGDQDHANSDEINSEDAECETAGGFFDTEAFRLVVLCHENDDLGLLEQPKAQTRLCMSEIRWEMWDLVEDIYRTSDVSPVPEIVSSCIGALLCSFSDMEPDMEDWLEIVRQEVGG